MRIAVPDLVSNSYFPASAADALGFYRAEGLDLSAVLISPIEACFKALYDGEVEFAGASLHAPLLAFPDFQGAKLLCAQSQGLYWFLVMRRTLKLQRGELDGVKGTKISAAPFVAATLRRVLAAAGLDLERDRITIVSPPISQRPGVNFGVTAAEALGKGEIDGFFANGMGTEIAVRSGAGEIVLDLRRGDGPPECFHYTMPAIATTDRLIADNPRAAAGVVRAIARTLKALSSDITLATKAGNALFPPYEASLIADIVLRDLPFYRPEISYSSVTAMLAFARDIGMLKSDKLSYQQVVAAQFANLWDA
jgi:ABC-type nitrate/sulfonate/bicarbonate transport system substrate-binding protein